jgi:hypothetical protein
MHFIWGNRFDVPSDSLDIMPYRLDPVFTSGSNAQCFSRHCQGSDEDIPGIGTGSNAQKQTALDLHSRKQDFGKIPRKYSRSWMNIMARRHSPILMSHIACGSFASGEKVLKIRKSAEDRQISKLISESRESSKHRPRLQFRTLLRLPVLLHQPYSLSSLIFFIWKFGTGDRSPTN